MIKYTLAELKQNPELLAPYKHKENFIVPCDKCGTDTIKTKHYLISKAIPHNNNIFCSVACRVSKPRITVNCQTCGKEIQRLATELSDNNFCSRSCSAKFTNIHRAPMTPEQKEKLIKTMATSEKVKLSVKKANNCSSLAAQNRRLMINCLHCGEKFSVAPYESAKKFCSIECAKPYMGGHRINSGRGISGHYKGMFCQSSYELAFIYDCLQKSRNIKRSFEKFPYVDENGRQRNYYPDFIIDNEYYEVKGFRTIRDEYKFKHFPHILHVIEGNDIEQIIVQIENELSLKRDKFYELYDNKEERDYPYTGEIKQCKYCGNDFPMKKKNHKGIYCSRSCSGKGVKLTYNKS